MRAFFTWLLILPIRAYRVLLSPSIGHSCRFQPSCSVYAIEALETHGPLRGLWLTIVRIARCNPWGGSGYDPVPPVADRNVAKGQCK
ncbi:MAG: membrane protein insertion efficiency factor YidD [Pseudomonadota bacterium]